MGQYFLPVIIDDAQPCRVVKTMHPYDYGFGLKIGEHAWCDNEFVGAFEILLALDGPQRVVWAGDYAEPDQGSDANLYHHALGQKYLRFNVPGYGVGRYLLPGDHPEPAIDPPLIVTTDSHPVLFNHDRHEYIRKNDVPVDRHSRRRHPLPWLTVEGGGMRPTPAAPIGRWARHRVSVSHTIPDGWTAVPFNLC